MTAAPPPAIIETSPPDYFWIGKDHAGKPVHIWCGQIVEEAAFWAKFADWIRSAKTEHCPKGRYP